MKGNDEMIRVVRAATLVGVDGGVVIGARPRGQLLEHVAGLPTWIAQAGADAVAAQVAAVLLWLAACWLGIGLAGAAATALPGAGGRAAAAMARLVLPRAMARVVAGATGLGVLAAPVVAGAAAPAVPAKIASAPASVPAPAWPSSTPLPAPDWPTGTSHRSAPGAAATSAPDSAPLRVVVHAGDSLWSIAARHLPGRPAAQRIARSWPHWYAANRRVVGADPGHIVPGEVLVAPAAQHPGGNSR